MGMVHVSQRIASAYTVRQGRYGDVQRYAQQRGVCRQWIYRESAWVTAQLDGTGWKTQLAAWQARVQDLEARLAATEQRLREAVVLDHDKQAEFASVGQAAGVSLAEIQRLLEVLLGARTPSVPTLGRWTKAAAEKARALLAVLDESTRPRVAQAAADEIYVRAPVLMVVEPDSLCWVSGRLTDTVTGDAWAAEFAALPALKQVTRDAGLALQNGVAQLNEQRQDQQQPAVADQLDHFHSLRGGSKSVRQAEQAVSKALAAVDVVEAQLRERQRQGQSLTGLPTKLQRVWKGAEQAWQTWQQRDQAWRQTQHALQLWTPEGELNTRARAEALLAETLPQLPDAGYAKSKRLLQRPQTLTYLDEVHHQLEALPVPAAVRQAAVAQEGGRRHPELLRGNSRAAAARRGMWLLSAVILAGAGAVGAQAVAGVRAVLRNTWRASSLVECINSVLRMQQARHRKLTQSLLDLKRLSWNCHQFRTGRRRGTSPYQRLGVPWPAGVRWWDLLKWSPEQLRDKLSTIKKG